MENFLEFLGNYISFSGLTPKDVGLVTISAIVSIVITIVFLALNYKEKASYVTEDHKEFVYVYENFFSSKYTKRLVSGGQQKRIKKAEFKAMFDTLTQRSAP